MRTNQNKLILATIVFIATIFLSGCKAKSIKVPILDSLLESKAINSIKWDGKARVYLNGPYLNYKLPKSGYVIQTIHGSYVPDVEHTSDDLTITGHRMGKYKKNKQEGKWVTERLYKGYKQREEHFKNGLQHGDYLIYNAKGDVVYYTEFINGTGIEKDYHPNGQLYYEIHKKDGYFTDTLKIYDDLGRLTEMHYFEKDSLVFSEEEHYSRRRVLEKIRYYRSIDHLLFPRIDSKK